MKFVNEQTRHLHLAFILFTLFNNGTEINKKYAMNFSTLFFVSDVPKRVIVKWHACCLIPHIARLMQCAW